MHQDQHDQRHKLIPYHVINRIRQLRLNCKKEKHTKKPRIRLVPTGVNNNNLIRIKKQANKGDTNLLVATCNTQLVKRKDLQVSGLLTDYSLDILVLTETWLSNNDTQWLETTLLNHEPYQMHAHNRQARRGGSIALITKSHYKVNTLPVDSSLSLNSLCGNCRLGVSLSPSQQSTTPCTLLEISPPMLNFWMNLQHL